VAGPGYATDMPAFRDRLGTPEITALVDYLKASWPPATRALQASLNPGGADAIAALLQAGGEWTFPPDCMTPAQRAAGAAWKAKRAGGTAP